MSVTKVASQNGNLLKVLLQKENQILTKLLRDFIFTSTKLIRHIISSITVPFVTQKYLFAHMFCLLYFFFNPVNLFCFHLVDLPFNIAKFYLVEYMEKKITLNECDFFPTLSCWIIIFLAIPSC